MTTTVEAVCKVVLATSLVVAMVESRVSSVVCEGGRSEGDKWFDGCKWCVCEHTGTVCSSSECSNLMSQVEPCLNVGSRWNDGCYECSCHRHGIECKADFACVLAVRKRHKGHHSISTGACVRPKDDRCICGVDGVPSCTAEAIDRNAHPARTIGLDVSFPGQDDSDVKQNWRHRSGKQLGMSDDVERVIGRRHRTRSLYAREPKSYRTHRRRISHSGLQVKNTHSDSLRRQDSLLVTTDNRCRWGVRWYGGSLRCYCDSESSVTCGDPSFVASRIDGFRLEKADCEEGHVWPDQDSCQICECPFSGTVFCSRSELCPLNFLIRPVTRHPKDHRKDRLPVESQEPNHNIRRLKAKIHNADKRKFIVDIEDTIEPSDDEDFNTAYRIDSSGDGAGSKQVLTSDSGADTISIKTDNWKPTHKSSKVTETIKHEREPSIKMTSKGPKPTIVKILECTPGSRWMDGCKRCRCDSKGRKYCDERRCLKARLVLPTSLYTPSDIRGSRPFRPVQKPPPRPNARFRPVVIRPPFDRNSPCQKFKVGDKYWEDCNICICMPQGPKCTAKSCG